MVKLAELIQHTSLRGAVFAGSLTALLAACVSPGPREREAVRLAEFESVAGAPVEGFQFWTMQRWEVLGPTSVGVWTRVNEAWLITVEMPCNGLEFASVIGVTSTLNRVSRAFDAIRFEQERCRIKEIRPVDGKALKQLRREKG